MKILYVAAGIPVPGNYGGSTHTLEVAAGLSRLGHDVHVVAHSSGSHRRRFERVGAVTVYRLKAPKIASFLDLPSVFRLGEAVKPDVVMERYYNTAGAGLAYARRAGLPSILEVNAPVVDPPGTKKHKVDRYLLLGLLSRWARAQCAAADRIVSPLASTVPFMEQRDKVFEISWGANVDHFSPDIRLVQKARVDQLRAGLGLSPDQFVVLFSGSFRPWHGVEDLVGAAMEVLSRRDSVAFLFIGDGPLKDKVGRAVSSSGLAGRIVLAGPVSYDEMPLYLALAGVGVAPFNTAHHPPLQQVGFYWSPLKVFEYMAMGLPVITTDLAPLNRIVRDGQDGRLFCEGDVRDLAGRIIELCDDRENIGRMGASGRERVAGSYSWRAHCEQLDRIIAELAGKR